jgi:hypothetical protein
VSCIKTLTVENDEIVIVNVSTMAKQPTETLSSTSYLSGRFHLTQSAVGLPPTQLYCRKSTSRVDDTEQTSSDTSPEGQTNVQIG